jgi:hypothetical protein
MAADECLMTKVEATSDITTSTIHCISSQIVVCKSFKHIQLVVLRHTLYVLNYVRTALLVSCVHI